MNEENKSNKKGTEQRPTREGKTAEKSGKAPEPVRKGSNPPHPPKK